MNNDRQEDLSRQSLGRPLESAEIALSEALEDIFGSGQHDMTKVAGELEERRIARPSGNTAPWTLAALEEELAAVNASLDSAHEQGGTTPLA